MARVTQDAKLQLRRRAPLFADLSKKALVEVARLSDDLEVAPGTVLAREGEIGYEFFVVVEGEVEFTRGGRTLAISGPVEFFGEVSLVEHTRRLATVTATTPLPPFVLGSRAFR